MADTQQAGSRTTTERTSRRPARIATMPEQERHRLGVGLFLLAAGISFVLSIALWFSSSHDEGLFVGIWVPSILSAGSFWLSAVRT